MKLLLITLAILFVSFCWVTVSQADPAGPFTWGMTTHMADGGWGRMIRLTDGRWLGVDARYPKPNSILQLEMSADNARTWTPLTTIAEAGRDLDNGDILLLPNGTILLSCRSVIGHHSFRLPTYQSTDSGRSWSLLSQVDTSELAADPPPTSGPGRPRLEQGLYEPYLFLLPDHRVAVAYANEKHIVEKPSYSQVCSERVSPDNGRTWGPEMLLASQVGGGELRPGMPVIARMVNGQYIAVYEVNLMGDADVYAKTSRDGVVWPPGLGARVPGHHAGPWISSLQDGRLVVSSCSNLISYSDDLGATWLRAAPPAWEVGHLFTWPAIYQTGSDEIGVFIVKGGVNIRWGHLAPRSSAPRTYADNFAAANDVGWTHYGGRFAFAEGAYLLPNTGTTGKALTGSEFWRDGDLEGDVMLTTAGNAGLLLRITNADDTGPDAAFGYYVGLDSDGFLFLSRTAYNYAQLQHVRMEVALNTWYHLRITMQSSEIRVSVNGAKTPILSASDSSFQRGQIGVRAHLCNAEFRHIRYQSQNQP